MFEQRRSQRGASPENKVRAALRLDSANALDDVRSNALERAPFKTLWTVSSDILRCRIEAVRHRTARRLWPVARPEIVGATAKQQIEALALRSEHRIPAGGRPIGRGPVAVGKIIVIGGMLDHAVQRDVFDDFELSHLNFTFAISGFGVNPSPKSSISISLRISTSPLPSGETFGARFTHSIASSSDLTLMIMKPATSSLVSVNGPSMTVRLSPLNFTRAPFEVGPSPSAASRTPAFAASSLYFCIATNASGFGGGAVSDSFVAIPMTMKRIVLS